MNKPKVVITGGAGFIGSHIAEYWAEQGADVHIVDNLRSGYEKNFAHLEGVTFLNGSITDRSIVEKAMEGADYVHHLAALISVPESVLNPRLCVEINIQGLLNVLEAAHDNNVKKLIHISSAAVYGDSPVSPKSVRMRPVPKTPYGITKLDGEYYLSLFTREYGMKTTSLRCFNVFGPRQDPNSQYAAAIPMFIQNALLGEDIIIYGDGKQTRDFVYVKDVVHANILAVKSDIPDGVFNVGCERIISIKELAELIIEITGSKSRIVFRPERLGDIKHSIASIVETKDALGYEPQFELIDGLKLTIEYFARQFEESGKLK
ncbi:MAG: SDR family NAD(P)-dependent oxidoreductase [Ignavibacteriaceae bacterium]|nr:SDR family NAD(P)-dependent oxidoreductase [Ignavibacteriaceae bacterium]